MTNPSEKNKKYSRRGILPILGSTLLLPFLGFGGSSSEQKIEPSTDEEYHTLLKPDGTSVKVKKSTIKKSKIIKKNVSNKSLLNWLGKKDKFL